MRSGLRAHKDRFNSVRGVCVDARVCARACISIRACARVSVRCSRFKITMTVCWTENSDMHLYSSIPASAVLNGSLLQQQQ